MENIIKYINNEENIPLKKDGDYFVKLDGKNIKNKKSYLKAMQKAFLLPKDSIDSVDAYLDWMTDLSWIMEKNIVLIILNYSRFLENDLEEKRLVISDFQNYILPFWQEKVKCVMVNGKPRSFQIYLVG